MKTKLFTCLFAFVLTTANVSAYAQNVQPGYQPSSPSPTYSPPDDHPVADGIGRIAKSGARAVGDIAHGVANGIDDVAHSTAQAVNPKPQDPNYNHGSTQ